MAKFAVVRLVFELEFVDLLDEGDQHAGLVNTQVLWSLTVFHLADFLEEIGVRAA